MGKLTNALTLSLLLAGCGNPAEAQKAAENVSSQAQSAPVCVAKVCTVPEIKAMGSANGCKLNQDQVEARVWPVLQKQCAELAQKREIKAEQATVLNQKKAKAAAIKKKREIVDTRNKVLTKILNCKVQATSQTEKLACNKKFRLPKAP